LTPRSRRSEGRVIQAGEGDELGACVPAPSESVAVKLADHRSVMARTGLTVAEVWYVDRADVTVHPAAADAP
jgi:hypothetical protein